MEQLSILLQPYKETVGAVAGFVTIAQFFSGVFLCKDIYNNKSTEGIPSMPFIGGIVVGILMLNYSLMIMDTPMLVVNGAAVLLNVLYTIFYAMYSKDKSAEIVKPLCMGFTLIAILFGYAFFEDPDLIEYRYGLIVTALILCLIASPLCEVGTILKTQDASCIPFPITFTGAICALLWLMYGICLSNDFMVYQNVVGFGLCAFQLGLWYKYPKVDQKDKKKRQ